MGDYYQWLLQSSLLNGGSLYSTPSLNIDTPQISVNNLLSSNNYTPNYTFGYQANNGIGDIAQQMLYNTQDASNQGQKIIRDTATSGILRGTGEEQNPTSFGDKFQNSFIGKNANIIGKGLDLVGGITSHIGGADNTFNGPHGNIREGIEQGWNGVSDLAMKLPGPYGKAAGLAMKAAGVVNNIQGAVFGATDGMTKLDAVMDSPLGMLTGLGWANQAFGKRSDTITKDDEAFATVGASYGGTESTVGDALEKSGKKYGAFSVGARHEANRQIAEAKRQQNVMSDIASTATDRFAIRDSMSAINGNSYGLALQGGYNQSAVRAGKYGTKLERARHIVDSYRKGGKKTRTLEQLIDYAKQVNPRFIQRLSEAPRGIEFVDDNGNLTTGNVYLEYSMDDNGNAIVYPRIQENSKGQLEFLSSDDAYQSAIWNKNYLVMTPEEAKIFFAEDPEYEVAYKRGWPEMFKNWDDIKQLKNGGQLEVDEFVYHEVEDDEFVYQEVEYFQKGGSINIIPEGALHARKHNLDIEGITKKGIPVISESEGGNIEQQAEIEHSEIIFRLEVTEKIEDYKKKYEESKDDQYPIEIGKLLVQEILHNTDDRTNLINQTQ